MEMEGTTFPVAEFSTGSPSPSDLMDYFLLQSPVAYTMDDLLGDGHTHLDPHSIADDGMEVNYSTADYSIAADGMQVNAAVTPSTVAASLDGHVGWSRTAMNPDLSQIQVQVQVQVPPHSVGDPTSSFTGAGTGPQPERYFSGDTTNYYYAAAAVDAIEVNAAAGQGHAVPQLVGLAGGPAAATGAEFMLQQSAHTEWDSPGINPVLGQTHVLSPSSVGEPSACVSSDATVTPSAAAVHAIASVEGAPREHNNRRLLLLVNGDASFTTTQPDQYSAAGPSTTTAAADMGISSPDTEVKNLAGLPQPQSGGGALTETPARGSCKRKKPVSASSSQRSTSEMDSAELLHAIVQSDPSSTDIKPPHDSTDTQIMDFLEAEGRSMPDGKVLNLRLGEQDQRAPEAVRSYLTTVGMMPDQKTQLGYWKGKQVKILGEDGLNNALLWKGLKRTFQFHRYDGTKTNWIMDEYSPTTIWGSDLFMEELRFRKVYKGPGDRDPEEVVAEIMDIIATANKHRIRGPDTMVIKGESQAWHHFIKIYDRKPVLEGSKVVYAVCCHCDGVLKAGTENGTKSLLNHCDRTCPVKNKNQQPKVVKAARN